MTENTAHEPQAPADRDEAAPTSTHTADETPPRLPPPPPPASPIPPSFQKAPLLAGFLSCFPGLGHVYNGLYSRAITFFLIWASLFTLSIRSHGDLEPLFAVTVTFFWFFNVFDAYRQAMLINYGYTAEPLPAKVGAVGGGGGVAGIVLVLIGLYGILERYTDFDLEWVLDQWPWLLIAFGVWMIVQGFWQKRKGELDAAGS